MTSCGTSTDWSRARDLAEKRLPGYQRLQALTRYADGLDAARGVQPQVEAIEANRSLLEATDPARDLVKTLADALRSRADGSGKSLRRGLR